MTGSSALPRPPDLPTDFDPDIVAQIRARLDRVREQGVVIAFAIETGSRAWGFPSPDSDYDCRFIYVRPVRDHLRLKPPRDVIEFPIEGLVDTGGWDLKKALLLGLGGNAVVNEWARSPLVYEEIAGAREEFTALIEEIAIPDDLNANEVRFGFEGITRVGEGDDTTLWMAVQREWKDGEKGFVKLVSYKPASKKWGAVSYPLDKGETGWVGLSEIVAHDGAIYIVERDNQIGTAAKIKKLYKVSLDQLQPAPLGSDLPIVKKELAHDFLPDLASLTNGYVVDKLEGFTFDADGDARAITDNDGVDDSSGETLFWKVDMTATN